jgi:hypothetical protein
MERRLSLARLSVSILGADSRLRCLRAPSAMSEMSKIERGIPIPPRIFGANGRVAKYPWRSMRVGESFTAPADRLNSIKVLIHRNSKPPSKKRFTWRAAEDGSIRVWREK